MVTEALHIIKENGPSRGLFLNVDRTELFWLKEDPKSREPKVFPPNISRPCAGVKILGRPVSIYQIFCRDFSLKSISKTIELMKVVSKLHDPRCELLLLHNCVGFRKFFYALRTCPSDSFWDAHIQFDLALRTSLEKIVMASGLDFGD